MIDPRSNLPSAHTRRVLIVTPDAIGKKMGGPAIRAWEIARRVSALAEVRLVSVKHASRTHSDFEVSEANVDQLKAHVSWAEVVVGQGEVFAIHPWLVDTDAIIVADVYDPLHFEALESARDQGEESRAFLVNYCVEMLTTQLLRADFVICASEKQRDLWLGHLAALGRVSPSNYDEDRSLRRLIDVVPFGVTDERPVQARHAIRGVVDGIGEDDKIILWGGGVYNWFDPLTLVRAVAVLAVRRPEVKLYFMGMRYPNPDVHESHMAAATLQLSDDLGLTGSHIFFNHDWVDFDDRVNYLMDADVGVSTHFNHIETAFSFRTRVLDYLWVGLPIIATDGDAFAPIIRGKRLGTVVPPQDVQALAASLEDLLFHRDTQELRHNVGEYSAEASWNRAIKPLIAFIDAPTHAADYPVILGDSAMAHHLQHIESLEATILVQGDKLSAASEELAAAQAELETMRQSTAWRLSAPLRALVRRPRRTRRS